MFETLKNHYFFSKHVVEHEFFVNIFNRKKVYPIGFPQYLIDCVITLDDYLNIYDGSVLIKFIQKVCQLPIVNKRTRIMCKEIIPIIYLHIRMPYIMLFEGLPEKIVKTPQTHYLLDYTVLKEVSSFI